MRADEDDSKAFFAQGRKLRLAGNCKDAIPAFRRALELWPQGLGSLRNIAECEEQLGQYASARVSYWDLRRAVLQSNEPNYDGWEKDAEAGFNRLASKVAKITVALVGDDVSGARVSIDGKPLDPRLVGVALERDLGPHTVEVVYGGAAPLTEQRTLATGDDVVVTFRLPHAGAAGSATASASAATPPPPFPFKPAAIAGFAAGAAAFVAMGVFIGVRADALAEIDATCPAHDACPDSLRGARDRGAAASTAVNVLAVTGAVAAGAGVALLLSSKLTSPARAAELRWAPVEQGGVLTVRGRF